MENQTQGSQMERLGSRAPSAIFFAGALFLLAFTHFQATVDGKVFPIVLPIVAFGLVLGFAGLVNPKITRALGREGKDSPTVFRVAGFLAVLAAILLWVVLWLVVYPTEDAQEFLRWISA